MLDITWNIAQAVKIPVMADVDTGGGNAVNAAYITERLIQMGVAGMNIEDQIFPKRCGHMAGKEVIDADEMAGKVKACAEVRDALDPDFIINARTDVFAVAGLDEAIRRCNLYLEAGADLGFIDGIKARADVETAVKALDGPLSVNLMDAISGMKTELIPTRTWRMGVGKHRSVASSWWRTKRSRPSFSALRLRHGTLPGRTPVGNLPSTPDFVLKATKRSRTSICRSSVWPQVRRAEQDRRLVVAGVAAPAGRPPPSKRQPWA